MTPPWRKDLLLILLAGCLVFTALAGYYAQGGVIDDSFISFRYAENYAQGHGLVFNPGEAPVEGYSNFLWVLALSACYQAGFSTVAASRVMGVLCGLGVLIVLWLVMVRNNTSPKYTALAIAATATAPALAVYAISGMETVLYSLLWILFLYLFLLEEQRASRRPYSGLVGALICLTRPEGFILLSIFGLLRLVQFCTDPSRRPANAIWFFEILIVFTPYLAWRYWYYGHLLPMPVYAKVTGEHLYRGLRQLLGGGRYLVNFAKTYGGGGLFGFLIAFALRQLWAASTEKRFSPASLLTLASGFFLWYLVYVVNVGGDWMPQYRFFVPLLPVMYLLISRPEFLQPFPVQYATLVPALFLLFNLLQVPVVLNATVANVEPYVQYSGISADPALPLRYQSVGTLLKGKTLATTECGMLPYYSGLRTIDMMGLNDEFIGMAFYRSRGLYDTKESVYDEIISHVLSLNPEVIHVGGGMRNNAVYCQKLLQAADFRTHYSLDPETSFGNDEFYLRRTDVLAP